MMSVCVQAVRGLLENPNEPVNELSYFDCIESVMENSKVYFELYPLAVTDIIHNTQLKI